MRVITGIYKGRHFEVPRTFKARPTTDFAKENIFNVLNGYMDFEDASALDLFAGTGALSLEAISRGAREAVLIDMDHAACTAIKKNMETSRLGDQCRLISRDYKQALEGLAREGKPFDVVFIDPPYRMENTGEMCAMLMDLNLLSDTCIILVEHKRGMPPLLDLRFEAYDLRRYRETEITFVRRARKGE